MNQPSEYFRKTFAIKANPKTADEKIFVCGNRRVSVITPNIIRIEKGNFCDKPTQSIYFREFPQAKPVFRKDKNIVTVSTTQCVFVVDIKKMKFISATLRNGRRITDFTSGNLKGTARTLDGANGSIPLGNGLISTTGGTIFDDSKSCILNEDGTISLRPDCTDLYCLAFGNDFRKCTKQMQDICGAIPLVPRFSLGNWWSRYHAYTQEEYLTLMRRFIEADIPITVATIDMDWHWVNLNEKFSLDDIAYNDPYDDVTDEAKKKIYQHYDDCVHPGWTGYSWNTDLFPDYKAMFNKLKEDGFRITMNLHPSQGVRAYEDQYEEMAKAMGIDPATKRRVRFNITDPKFVENYFKILHKPYEADGVDFWWIDWQQEKITDVDGLDPLWALNHYHTLVFSDENKRPLILSRFAEVGSHRYALGFSGDTIITWDSLQFQPYFTSTAANVNYTWWSHDIGGHTNGIKDDELYARWVQLGVYSPINRLHSTSDEFMGKEPWKYSYAARSVVTDFLRQRHAMIPYIYTMNRRTHCDGIALCEPMYYSFPDEKEAYAVRNEFMFGSELLVVPVTTPMSKLNFKAETEVWLPKGRWTNIYTGRIYEGNRMLKVYDDLDTMPVFAKEGAILPLSANCTKNDCSNPASLKIRIWRGNNSFGLYEDDGETMDFEKGAYCITKLENKLASGDVTFKINPAAGDTSLIPQQRDYELCFDDIQDSASLEITRNGNRIRKYDVVKKSTGISIRLTAVSSTDEIVVTMNGITPTENPSKREQFIEDISRLQMSTDEKKATYNHLIPKI